MDKLKIVITDGFTLNPGDLDWAPINALGIVEYFDSTAVEDVTKRCAVANVIITNKTPISRETIESAKELKLIAVTATGYNIIDTVAARERGVVVCNVPEYGTWSVAQHTFALILELVNHVGINSVSVSDGEWEKSPEWCYSKKPLTELYEKVIGIVGFGRIGQQVAGLAKAFGMKVQFVNRSKKQSDLGTQVSQEELFRSSDVISLHCPLTEDTQSFVNAKLLGSMKPSAILINTSRGQLINEADLADALKNKWIAAAGLDVLSSEPPAKGNSLIGIPNCIITPHTAWMSFEARKRLMKITAENVGHFIDGRPVNKIK